MNSLVAIVCVMTCATASAFGAVQVTTVRHTQSCFAESLDDGLVHDSVSVSEIGPFAIDTSAEAGYPTIVADATASEESIAIADASEINGVLTSNAHSRTLEFDHGMSSSFAYVAVAFVVDRPIDFDFSYDIQSVATGARASNYTEVGLLDRIAGVYLYLVDFGANASVQAQRRLLLAPGEYELELLCESFTGVISDPDAGENSSTGALTYSAAFIPGPWTLGLFSLFAARRRR